MTTSFQKEMDGNLNLLDLDFLLDSFWIGVWVLIWLGARSRSATAARTSRSHRGEDGRNSREAE